MSIHFYSKLSCNLLDWNFERASTLNGLALSISHVIDKLEFIYSHNQSKSFCNYCNDKLHNEGFRLNLYSIPNRPIV